MLGFIVTITVIYVMPLLHSYGELAIGLALHVFHMQILTDSRSALLKLANIHTQLTQVNTPIHQP